MGSFVGLESLFVLGVWVLGLSCSYETPGPDTLISRNATVTASSNNSQIIYDVSHAVDGSTNSCASTRQQNQPWIQIDLGNVYEVTGIEVVDLTNLNYSISEISIYLHDETTNWIQNHTLVEKIAEENVQYYNKTLANPVKARYVTLQSQKNDVRLSVCEVNIYGRKVANNLTPPDVQVSTSSLGKGATSLTTSDVQVSTSSLGKGAFNLTTPGVQVSASSLRKGAINLTSPDVQVSMSSFDPGRDATKAIDGLLADSKPCNCCSETKQDTSSWWQVDLGRPFFVKQLVVYARTDEKDFKQLVGFSVFTSLTKVYPQTAIFTSQDRNLQDNTVVVDLPDVAARFVRIQRAGVLTICEIEIIHLATSSYFSGGRPQTNALLEPEAYRQDYDFNYVYCPVHTYGRECAPCGPCNNGSCDPVIGVCPYGCYEGYIGNKCETFDTVTTKVTSGFVGAGALAGLLIVVAVVIGAVLLAKNRRIQIYEQTMVKWTKGPTTNDSEYCTLDEQERQRRVTIEVKPAEESATDEPE